MLALQVLCLRRFHGDATMGALLGVELKKKLTWQGIRQAECEYYLWAHYSDFPFIQLITDMQRGGVVFFSTGVVGKSPVRQCRSAYITPATCATEK